VILRGSRLRPEVANRPAPPHPHRSVPLSKHLLTTLAAASALAMTLLPTLAHSRQVTLTAQLKSYGGDGA